MNKVEMSRERYGMLPPTREIADAGVMTSDGSPRFGISAIGQYLSVLRRRKWVILGAVVASILLGALVTLLMTPKFTAAAMIEIQREARNFTDVRGAEDPQASSFDQEFYQTQYGLLESRSLAERVAIELRLFDNAKFFTTLGSSKGDDWFEDGRLVPNASTRDVRIDEAAEVLLDNLEVDPERMSRLITVRFTSPDAALSKRVVDAWSTNFIRQTLERRFDATAYARDFLEGRLAQLRTRIDESERQLVTYAAQQNIVNLPAATEAGGVSTGSTERPLVVEDLAIYNRELARATADRVLAQSRLATRGDQTIEGLQNQAITDMRARRAGLAAEYARMMVQFEPAYPPALALQTQIQGLDESIVREEQRVRSALRETYRASLQREQDLRGRVNDLKVSLLDTRRRSIQYNIFQREVDTNRQLYDALLQRYKEIGIAGGVGVNNVSIVDPAELPDRPSSPNLTLNLLIALMAGAAIGIGLALALDQIDEGVLDPSEVEKLLGVPLLGIIPRADDQPPKEALADPKSAIAEAYLSLQTSLAFATEHGTPRSLAVTSSKPTEGKTTTSYALAQLLARAGRRTLLIDADMRSPSIQDIVDLRNDRGLSNYLAGDDDFAGLIQVTSIGNLSVMLAGPQPPNAGELLAGERLERLILLLHERFDNVVVDAPPVMGLADAPLIGSRVEGLVFVLESNATKKGMARVAISRVLASHSQLFGVVLTKFDATRAHFGYGYDYGYGYGYGSADEAAAKS